MLILIVVWHVHDAVLMLLIAVVVKINTNFSVFWASMHLQHIVPFGCRCCFIGPRSIETAKSLVILSVIVSVSM